MAPRSRTDEVVQRSFRDLLHSRGAAVGNSWGWKARVAGEIGVSPEHLSRLLSGARRASTELILFAARRYGVDAAQLASEPSSQCANGPPPPLGLAASPCRDHPQSAENAGTVVDVRLVLGRDGTWAPSIEGRKVPSVVAGTPSFVLVALGRAIEAAAWTSGRAELDEATDAASELFASRSRKVAP